MNRIDRLFAVTLLLQSRKRVRAQDLACKFAVTERAIYRDIAALNEARTLCLDGRMLASYTADSRKM